MAQARVEAEAFKVLSDLHRCQGELEAALEAAEERGLGEAYRDDMGGFDGHGGILVEYMGV